MNVCLYIYIYIYTYMMLVFASGWNEEGPNWRMEILMILNESVTQIWFSPLIVCHSHTDLFPWQDTHTHTHTCCWCMSGWRQCCVFVRCQERRWVRFPALKSVVNICKQQLQTQLWHVNMTCSQQNWRDGYPF